MPTIQRKQKGLLFQDLRRLSLIVMVARKVDWIARLSGRACSRQHGQHYRRDASGSSLLGPNARGWFNVRRKYSTRHAILFQELHQRG